MVRERDFVDFFTKLSGCRTTSLPFLSGHGVLKMLINFQLYTSILSSPGWGLDLHRTVANDE